ncbi:DUF2213 domain-containing protein [Natroniella sp. ANB-PHB2]|uniref:DUF2213 domain-containing protein n=1 Tax=Natroniella sp. ANB-PHB2 TaxID=3384444 RepID=UPI0038D4D543
MFRKIAGFAHNNKQELVVNNEPNYQLVVNQATITINKTRRETYLNREYLVAPVVAVKPKVLNGEKLPFDELAYSWQSWEGVPLTLNHPTKEGQKVAANRLDVRENYYIGRFHNVSFDFEAEELKGEVWLDIERCQQFGGEAKEVLDIIEEGEEAVEVSTGYYRLVERAEGVFKGQSYNGVQRNILPDHLAVLPNDTGACSVEDGCGIKTNQSESNSVIEAINKGFSKVINMFKRGEKMDKEKLIEQIVNCEGSGFTANSKDLLAEMEVKQLATIAKGLDCDQGQQSNQTNNSSQGQQQNNQGQAGLENVDNEMLQQVVNSVNQLTEKVESLEGDIQSNKQEKKDELVEIITNAEQDLGEKEELQELPVDYLEKLARVANSNYAGQGGPINLGADLENNEEEVSQPKPVLLRNRKKEEDSE